MRAFDLGAAAQLPAHTKTLQWSFSKVLYGIWFVDCHAVGCDSCQNPPPQQNKKKCKLEGKVWLSPKAHPQSIDKDGLIRT